MYATLAISQLSFPHQSVSGSYEKRTSTQWIIYETKRAADTDVDNNDEDAMSGQRCYRQIISDHRSRFAQRLESLDSRAPSQRNKNRHGLRDRQTE